MLVSKPQHLAQNESPTQKDSTIDDEPEKEVNIDDVLKSMQAGMNLDVIMKSMDGYNGDEKLNLIHQLLQKINQKKRDSIIYPDDNLFNDRFIYDEEHEIKNVDVKR